MTSRSEFNLDAAIARTAATYDALPYETKPFPRSSPARMAAIATMFGLEPPPPMQKARVLELGCAAGGNLIPHAAHYPGGEFVGFDLGPKQVADGQARIARAGLTNVQIHLGSITDLPEDLGQFDYIISHGVYSWVPEPVRHALLAASRRLLAPNGIAYISYNVLPGWRTLEPLRDAFRLMIPDQLPPAQRVSMARELMEFFSTNCDQDTPYAKVLREAKVQLSDNPDDYVFHEYMEQNNEPCTFSDFVSTAAQHGLAYLAESDLETMVPEQMAPKAARFMRERTNNDLISVEQLIDVFSGRTFRQTLLVASERFASIQREFDPARLERLHFLTFAGTRVESDAAAVIVSDGRGRRMRSTVPAIRPALERLGNCFPRSISFAECAGSLAGSDRTALAEALHQMVIAAMIDIVDEPIVASRGGARPRATALVRSDVAAGQTLTANLRHEAVQIDPLAKALIPALDGKTGRRDLERYLIERSESAEVAFTRNGLPIRGPALRQAVAEQVPRILEAIGAAGLLEA